MSSPSLGCLLAAFLFTPFAAPAADETERAEKELPDLARVKQEEALSGIERLEEMMDRVSRLLARTEPRNAAKLRMAFRRSREGLVREKMERIVRYLREKKLDRAVESQEDVKVDLEELLDILLEKDLDPRELLRHIKRLLGLVKDLDKIIAEETSEKLASDEAERAGAESKALSKDVDTLEDLILRQTELEKESGESREKGGEGLRELKPKQREVRDDTRKLREGDAQRGKPGEGAQGKPGEGTQGKPGEGAQGKPGEGAQGKPGEGAQGKPGEGAQGKPGEGAQGKPGEGAQGKPGDDRPRPGPLLDRKKLERAERAMRDAEDAMERQDAGRAATKTSEARAALEEAAGSGKERLQRLRRARDFAGMKEDQDETKSSADELAEKMREPPPLVPSEEGDVPGRKDVQEASGNMGEASGQLGQGRPGGASRSQKKAIENLSSARRKTEEALEALQQALRERLIAYLKEKFTHMLHEQRAIRADTRSLDLKLKALRLASSSPSDPDAPRAIDRMDRQRAQSLASREGKLRVIADDVIDLLTEDGTSLVFPEIVGEIADDLDNAKGLLARIETGALTQSIQEDVEKACEQILAALEDARLKPPPPSPNQGRSGSGTAPLLPKSSELKMVRALQLRVNKRTREFDLDRPPDENLSPEKKLQVEKIARKQKEVENLLRKVARSIGESSPSR